MRIDAAYAAFGTRVLDASGKESSRSFGADFRHQSYKTSSANSNLTNGELAPN